MIHVGLRDECANVWDRVSLTPSGRGPLLIASGFTSPSQCLKLRSHVSELYDEVYSGGLEPSPPVREAAGVVRPWRVRCRHVSTPAMLLYFRLGNQHFCFARQLRCGSARSLRKEEPQ